ncbi:alpha/beta fold hydrolase [Cellulophaga sp. 20_2_10]|uniref:YheT family hydrolase n=1 Tax=Cellulophaga sp. 20_2_10 TaxID=2942476 RepID=UPI00201A49B9|nr:alpha/beta fold hydrolase [Cellulophaga sp. 20_2_10]MCL5246304.1 alpha/beta fold hydrolase [Cellulophaga sp. 20_2_10]
MPILESTYNPSFLFKSGHFSTLYTGLFRSVEKPAQQRERIYLEDGDFLDLDWSFTSVKTTKVAVVLHGLEGNAQRPYILGAVQQLLQNNYSVCAVNLRGCSGETNILYRSYHSGATEDLDAVVQHIVKLNKYSEIILQGFSLGGNLVLKYVGEERLLSKEIKAAVGVSVPCSLGSSLQELLKPKNVLYATNFKKRLIEKLKIKQQQFPDKVTTAEIKKIKTLKDFDDVYTSRANGFKNAIDYYNKASCLQFLPDIKIPTLILNAKNDSFLGEACYPLEETKANSNLFLEIPLYGGHVGFYGDNNITYAEKRVVKFLEEHV